MIDDNSLFLIVSIVIIIFTTLAMDKFRNQMLWNKTPKIIKFLLGYH